MPSHWTCPEEHPGAFLRQRFLEPLGIAAIDLARSTHIPRSRISEILSGKRRITADTAQRLAAFLGVEPEFWMGLQSSWDLAQATLDTSNITPADSRGFLIGPAGVQHLTPTSEASTPTLAHMDSGLLARLRERADQTPKEAPRELVHVRYESGQHAWISTSK